MASSSSSSSICIPDLKYDVFLNFRGADTRNNFMSHFHSALCSKGINVFIDNQLKGGDPISSLTDVIIQSAKISVTIFSEDYASSRWCLDELAKIIECKKKYSQIVIPVFYHVDPSDVRHQAGKFGELFTNNYDERYKDEVHKWRDALKETANLSGWHLDETKSESKLMGQIINDILKRLKNMFSSDYKDLVGVESTIQKIESSFWSGINDRCIVGIWGIGGVGKTTIATAVYNKISSQFESSYFAQNVREESQNPNGLTHMREKLLSKLLEISRELCHGTPNMGNSFIQNMLLKKKVLIVFDDVTSFEQIEVLIGDPKHLSFGSRVIITTRDRQVIGNSGVHEIHPVDGLFDHDALKLFSQCAFNQDSPLADYTKLSNKAVRCAKGIPLALKVLGRHLQNRQKQDWESALDKLEESPHMYIQEVLRISYDGLNYEEKDLFLDIACFFNGWKKFVVKEIFDSLGLPVQIGLSVLIDKALITISNNIITMHDLLQLVGREIVKQESIHDPGQRSRLFHHNDIHSVLSSNTGTRKILGICFDMSNIREIHLTPRAFSNILNLRILIVYNSIREKNNMIHGFDGIESNFRELRYLSWHEYPQRSLPSQFHPEHLNVLKMHHGKLEQLWTGIENLANLKYIDLSYSNYLLKIPDLSLATNLESLILKGCKNLYEITPPSIQNVTSLVTLNLEDCRSLTSLPMGIQAKSLRFVILSRCSNLNTTPKISSNMEQLWLDGTSIEVFSSLIEYPSKLDGLNLEKCLKLGSLPKGFDKLNSLKYLLLSGCSNLKTISELPCELEELDLEGTAIKELPSSITCLSNLIQLKLRNCSKLESLPEGFHNLESLECLILSGCSNLKTISELPCGLEELDLDGSAIKELPSSITYLSNLVQLKLRNCSKLESLPKGFSKLESLEYLFLTGCSNLKTISELPFKLIELDLDGTAIKELPLCLDEAAIKEVT
ncbi:disease resistance protein RPP2B-like [Pistacia vera]|uniref:disease resistance protein RPP2B-like n=1 Tax=Pistacia vera TaxID=55513 RepID=UPI001262CC99|nr:disease resistance protein RPP2B-like [Pistacia vera]XP_031250540.1 disease resistance protein RPP2B-like [Pistacia vera]XP_031250541.1 disease resistance protein RPP2B-like [Pistacia vera]